MGIGYNARINVNIPIPIPKELRNLHLLLVKNIAPFLLRKCHFHIRGDSSSVCYELAHAVSDVFEPVST